MSDAKDSLIRMGFSEEIIKEAIASTGDSAPLENIVEWIEKRQNESNSTNAKKMLCQQCNTELDMSKLGAHAVETGHTEFVEIAGGTSPSSKLSPEERLAMLQEKLASKRLQEKQKFEEEQKRAEIERRKRAKEVAEARKSMEEKSMEKDIQERARQKKEDAAHKARILAMIEEDKKERARKIQQASERAPIAPPPVSLAMPQSSRSATSDKVVLKIKTPEGPAFRVELARKDTMSKLFSLVDTHLQTHGMLSRYAIYNLVIPHPVNRTFTRDSGELAKTVGMCEIETGTSLFLTNE